MLTGFSIPAKTTGFGTKTDQPDRSDDVC